MPLAQHEIEAATAELQATFAARDAAVAEVWRKLDPLLEVIADALAELPPNQWHALCAEERETLAASIQFWNFAGLPEVLLVPQLLIGTRVLELLGRRYPLLLRDTEGDA